MPKNMKLKRGMSMAVAILMLCCAVAAAHAQTAQRLINYKCKNEPLSSALRAVERQSGYYRVQFTYSDVDNMTVTADIKNATAPAAISALLDGKPLESRVQGQFIYISKSTPMTRQNSISGYVFDTDNTPLIGAVVRNATTRQNTVTDADGHFSLKVNSPQDRIVLSCIGKCEMQVRPELGKTMTLVMEDNEEMLSDVVVTGYQTIKRTNATGSFGFVSAAKLSQQSSATLEEALEGQIAGLRVNTVNDGTSQEPILRGVGTLSNEVGTQPLLVIDDMPTNMSLSDINPLNVESITVLKDAAAASIYGSRAANGVIVVTTKEAKGSGAHVSASADWFLTTKPNFDALHLMSTSEMIDMETQLFEYNTTQAGGIDDYFKERGYNYYSPLYQLYRDQHEGKITQSDVDAQLAQWRKNDYYKEYRDELWRTALTQRYNVNVSQRTSKGSHVLTFNYTNNKGREKSDFGTNTWNAYFKSNYQITNWLSIDAGLDASLSAGKTGTSYGYDGQERYLRLRDEQGNSVTYPNASQSGDIGRGVNLNTIEALAHADLYKPFSFNALDQLYESQTKDKNVRMRPFVKLEARFLNMFRYALSYQYEWASRKTERYDEEDSYYMRMTYNGGITPDGKATIPVGGKFQQGEYSRNSYTLRNQLNFEKSYKEHSFNALMGLEFRQSKTPRNIQQLFYGYNPVSLYAERMDWYSLWNNGFASELYDGRTQSLSGLPVSQSVTFHRNASFYATAGYTLMSRYNLTGSIRWDEADLFGLDTNEQKHPLWSLGAGWIVSQEKFMEKSQSWLDYLKLRLTYGVNGNVDQSSTTYFVARTKTIKNPVTADYLEYDDDDLPNPYLRWEKTATLNMGIDFRLFNNLLNGSIEYYNRHASDLLVRRYMDPTLGATSRVMNNGEMRNRGLEMTLNANLLRNRDWTIGASLTFALNGNKIISVDQDINATAISYIRSPQNYFIKGNGFNTLWAYRLSRVENGYPVILDADGNEMVKFNEDGDVESVTSTTTLKGTDALKDRGTITPKYNGGLSLNVRWRDIELNAMLIYSGGNKLRMPTPTLTEGGDDTYESLYSWDGQNGVRLFKDMSTTARQYASIFDDWWQYCDAQIKSAAFAKLRTINLSYHLPNSVCRKLGLQSLRLRLQANNLLSWAAAGNDIDPETFGLNGGSRGMKTPKTFSIGLSTSF